MGKLTYVFMEKVKYLLSNPMNEVCYGLKRIYRNILGNGEEIRRMESRMKQKNNIFDVNAHCLGQ